MVNKFIGWLALCAISSTAAALSPVALKDGINRVDLNQDGEQDYVVVAQFDNNTSHPNLGMTFFVRRPDGGHSIMPVANSNTFTWFDYRLSAAADFLVQDNQLFLSGGRYFLVSARKEGENAFDPAKVILTIYGFHSSQDDPGVPLYEWSERKRVVTQDTYQSVDEAYQEVDEAMLAK
ncbi:CpmJ protein [Pectobacterium brasiliense]|uniref:CpmJ protein n=1 Tax=Pectobacterium brasiliense TaxID=180957 RepID=A0AAE2WJ21_9GAMM|nr:CpmJ protein [Pectobacterium brasiliense]MBA0216577.1 CpmJ protein [Pectobacterium brasiliense]MBN3052834.1 CpmJ protein [Pectobacterium brasiliense]MBN3073630.1 CpmJ protein [Pectobacterium brasiliense]MBN3171125.1 CpmJ protein [Pectobacterium brasiliense]